MRSSRVVRVSDSQCRSLNCPGFDSNILRHCGIWGAADEAVLNIVHKKKKPRKKSPFIITVHKRQRKYTFLQTPKRRLVVKDPQIIIIWLGACISWWKLGWGMDVEGGFATVYLFVASLLYVCTVHDSPIVKMRDKDNITYPTFIPLWFYFGCRAFFLNTLSSSCRCGSRGHTRW